MTKQRPDVSVTADDLLHPSDGTITEHGLRWNLKVGIQYLESWLGGNGCVPLYNLMEDAATAEISRSQVWQWLHHRAKMDDGREVTEALYSQFLEEEMDAIKSEVGDVRFKNGKYLLASQIFDQMIRREEFTEFLTLPAYEYLD